MRHPCVSALGDLVPRVAADAFVHPTACLIGDASVGARCFVGPFAVLRGDNGPIRLDPGSNVQDHAVLHAGPGGRVHLERHAQAGHSAVLHGCTLRENSLVGMKATVLDGAVVERDGLLAAQALLPRNAVTEAGGAYAGIPAQCVRRQTPQEIAAQREAALRYVAAAQRYRTGLRATEPAPPVHRAGEGAAGDGHPRRPPRLKGIAEAPIIAVQNDPSDPGPPVGSVRRSTRAAGRGARGLAGWIGR